MTIDDRLLAMRSERTHMVALMGRKNGLTTLAKHFDAYERAIRLLIEQRDGEAKAHGTFSAAWRQSVIDRYNAAVLSAMDG